MEERFFTALDNYIDLKIKTSDKSQFVEQDYKDLKKSKEEMQTYFSILTNNNK